MSNHTYSKAFFARHLVRIAAVGAVFLAVAACGNKGPLVMPQKPVPVEVQQVPDATPAASQTPAESSQPVDGAKKPIGDDGKP